MNLVNTSRTAIIAVLILISLILGCKSNSNDQTNNSVNDNELELATSSETTSLKLEDVEADTLSSTTTAGRTLLLRSAISSEESIDELPMSFYLVSESTLQTTDESEGYEQQYYIGSTTISNIKEGWEEYLSSIVLPNDIKSGYYYIIGYLDPYNIYGQADNSSKIYKSDRPVYISTSNNKPDIVAKDLNIDDDVVVVNDEDQEYPLSCTLVAVSSVANASNVTIQACLEIDGFCNDLMIYDPLNKSYKGFRYIDELESNILKYVSIDFLIPKVVLESIEPSTIKNATLIVTLNNDKIIDEDDETNYENNIVRSQISLYSISDSNNQTKSLARKIARKLVFTKDYYARKYGKYFGGKVDFTGKAEFNSDGSCASIEGKAVVQVLKYKYTFLRTNFDAAIEPASFENTGYDITIKFGKKTIYTKNKFLKSIGLNTEKATLTESEKEGKTIDEQNRLRKKKTMKNNKQALEKADKKEIKNKSLKWSLKKSKGNSAQFWVSVVPLNVSAGARGEIGIKGGVNIEGITKLNAGVTPFADIGAYAQAGVGVWGYSAGVEGKLSLIREEFSSDVTSEIALEGDENYITTLKGSLAEKIVNNFKGPNGKINLYAKYTTVKWCKCLGVPYPCGKKRHKKTKNIANWSSYSRKKTLLNKKQTLFKIDL